MGIQQMLKERNLPPLKSREEMKEILLEKMYGKMPDTPYEVSVGEPRNVKQAFCEGTAGPSTVDMTITTQYGSHTFPLYRFLHNDGKKRPLFIQADFHPGQPSLGCPAEEIADRGFDVISFCYTEVQPDYSVWSEGLATVMFPPKARAEHENMAGKISLWAWAASRVLDYALTLPSVDEKNVAVIGHSRLGKTALVAGMMDERFKYVISNDSGCCGAALVRGGNGVSKTKGPYGQVGEPLEYLADNVPSWFAPNFLKYAHTNVQDGFDQHYLLATIAPRHLYVASGSMDDWADPNSEFLGACAASEMWEKQGLVGLVHDDHLPGNTDTYQEGGVAYHRRHGKHALSRYDWNKYMDYILRHLDD